MTYNTCFAKLNINCFDYYLLWNFTLYILKNMISQNDVCNMYYNLNIILPDCGVYIGETGRTLKYNIKFQSKVEVEMILLHTITKAKDECFREKTTPRNKLNVN